MHRCRHRPDGSVVALRARAGAAARQHGQRCSTTRLPAHRAHSELAPWAPLATSGSEDCRAGDHPRRTRDKRHTVDLPPPHRIRFAVGASGRMHTSCWGSGGGGGSAAGSRGRTREKCAPSRARAVRVMAWDASIPASSQRAVVSCNINTFGVRARMLRSCF